MVHLRVGSILHHLFYATLGISIFIFSGLYLLRDRSFPAVSIHCFWAFRWYLGDNLAFWRVSSNNLSAFSIRPFLFKSNNSTAAFHTGISGPHLPGCPLLPAALKIGSSHPGLSWLRRTGADRFRSALFMACSYFIGDYSKNWSISISFFL